MKLISCPECENQILERMGTICPKCGHTVGYFNESEKRPKYGKFFALSVFLPFLSFLIIIISSINKISFIFGVIFFLYVAYKSCPYLHKELFITKFEGIFFWGVWILVNSLLLSMIYNVLNKLALV
ncbi:hypothetical protein [Poseidonibacter ostreae]|jgi:uncharacterized membrane protein YvbJ|uniref:Zinc ribbon domain-containing protein n=1 Tax=Poseidonibacter ostreae TaxID=2654171 RepID=A0A6L4WV25_9BACT|nr:hypothetical protein [Poseidonibacter ostreae]KAB7886436.1 hypothetical protein GA417_05670 [Poseidonibacter ostreae]KAB7890303.1 hypothetical protein GBG19_03485 [Poseidonibacter ostreae]KAB7891536.1 hypothetical protein GBG18_06645 [Poseidonibacter ostreae]MAC84467.1 hypothetical protein [Arcobacter sp.]|tara:strand:+ start:4098 stop:4475 length:378 start_codon:yes stop_codon:yes gene_type:complete